MDVEISVERRRSEQVAVDRSGAYPGIVSQPGTHSIDQVQLSRECDGVTLVAAYSDDYGPYDARGEALPLSKRGPGLQHVYFRAVAAILLETRFSLWTASTGS